MKTLHDFNPALAVSWRIRRRMLGIWRRFTRPEYWPAVMFYVPVALYLLLRKIFPGNKVLDFTACNPCMPAGGFAGESKSDILDQIRERETVPVYHRFPADEPGTSRCQRLETFRSQYGLTWPLVLKPDVGQRGSQVVVAHTRETAEETLRTGVGVWIAQAYASGEEFGVFMIRHPESNTWEIFDITVKTPPVVIGDGRHTLRDLILADDRTVCQAKVHFQTLRARLREIPNVGEHILLSPLGNHCRGTRFENGNHLVTEALLNRMTRLCENIPGFDFGRFDLKVPNAEHLMRGENIQIIELNGLTSEATGIYDARNGYRTMLTVLLRQWGLASAIGKANQKKGHEPASFHQFIKLSFPKMASSER